VVEASLLQTGDFDAIDREAVSTIAAAIAKAKAAPMPNAADLMTDVYVSY
jgi:pyruvate dehydrogenase E1 component alpha subunit